MFSNNQFILPQQSSSSRKRKGKNDGIMELLRVEMIQNKLRDERHEEERVRRNEWEQKQREDENVRHAAHAAQQQQFMQLMCMIMMQNKATTDANKK
jgi:hypothetical protein